MTLRVEHRNGQWWAALNTPHGLKMQVVEPWLAEEIRDKFDLAASATGARSATGRCIDRQLDLTGKQATDLSVNIQIERVYGMRSLELTVDGDPLLVRIRSDRGLIAQHIVHAVGPNGSLAFFRGGPGVPDEVPRPAGARPDTSPESIQAVSIPAALPPALGEALERWHKADEDNCGFRDDADMRRKDLHAFNSRRAALTAYREHRRPRASGENAAALTGSGQPGDETLREPLSGSALNTTPGSGAGAPGTSPCTPAAATGAVEKLLDAAIGVLDGKLIVEARAEYAALRSR